jgi:transposase
MCSKIEIPLDIENIDIKNVVFTKTNEILIFVESTLEGTSCRCCGKLITKFHGHNRELKLRHLSILNKKTYICIKPRRYICDDCENHPTTTQKLSWYDERSSCTKRFEKYMMLLLVNSTVLDVSYKADMILLRVY